jgi:hydroxymethylpyrimidine pyrophosphatase-like HAD family hydrolase
MGRPYAEELALLAATYSYACSAEVGQLADAVNNLRSRPLLVVGSGGSTSACHFVARLHEAHARLPARVLTPLEFIQHPIPQAAGVLLLSAGGSNPDILAAAAHAISSEYSPVLGVCAREGTPLRTQLAAHRHAMVFEFVGPAKKDGFLATNSLVMTCALLARSYGVLLPDELPALAVDSPGIELKLVEALCQPNIVVLAGGWALSAAMDMESKWAESGFGSVTVTDARNFAHGRHHGVSRRMDESLMLALVTADALGLAEDTMRRLPSSLRKGTIQTPLTGEAGALDLLIRIIQLTGAVGARLGVDPGRPRVPKYGRTLYHAGVSKRALDSARSNGNSAIEELWIRRKVSHAVWESASMAARADWRERCQAWVASVEESRIGAVVFDYDGTLCEADERYDAPAAAIGAALTQLIDDGMVVGVATGRGDSVLDALRTVLPERVWPRVVVGMYNGGIICRLQEQPRLAEKVVAEVALAHAILVGSPVIKHVATLRVRPTQVTVRAVRPLPDGFLRRSVVEALEATVSPPDVGVFTSGHTVDVISHGASKLHVVDAVRQVLAEKGIAGLAIMTIGDQGQSGGNDGPFLAHRLGLSVENVSSIFEGCWNVAPVGERRTSALLGYLKALRPVAVGGFHWSVDRAARPAKPQPTKRAVTKKVTPKVGGKALRKAPVAGEDV